MKDCIDVKVACSKYVSKVVAAGLARAVAAYFDYDADAPVDCKVVVEVKRDGKVIYSD